MCLGRVRVSTCFRARNYRNCDLLEVSHSYLDILYIRMCLRVCFEKFSWPQWTYCGLDHGFEWNIMPHMQGANILLGLAVEH